MVEACCPATAGGQRAVHNRAPARSRGHIQLQDIPVFDRRTAAPRAVTL